MTIGNLVNVVPVPAAPMGRFGGPWEPIEAQVGSVLPQDYKDFYRLYGLGQFMTFFGIFSPISQCPYIRLALEISGMPEIFNDPEVFPYPSYTLWPTPGGLLPCGRTDYGDYIFWRTEGPPDDWSIVFWSRGFNESEAFNCDLTDFLVGAITGECRPKDFPDDFEDLKDSEVFVPFRDIWPERV